MQTRIISSVKEITYRHIDVLLVLGLFTTVLGGLIFWEKIQINQGFGSDGATYGEIATDFERMLADHEISSYRIQRIFPSVVVYYIFKLLTIPYTPFNIIMGFGMLNVIFLTGSAWAWCQISNHLKISLYAKLVGFICLFANFAVLKLPSYYPVLTDIPAYALGIFALYFYLKDFRVGLYFLLLIGAFTWTTIAYECVLLILFPHPTLQSSSSHLQIVDAILSFIQKNFQRMMLALVILLGVAWVLFQLQVLPGSLEQQIPKVYMYRLIMIMFFLFLSALLCLAVSWLANRYSLPANFSISILTSLIIGIAIGFIIASNYKLGSGAINPIVPLLPLSIAVVILYIFIGFYELWNSPELYHLSYWLQGFRLRMLILIFFTLLIISGLQALLSGFGRYPLSPIGNILFLSIVTPAKFLVAHVIYFGPFVLLIVFSWKQVCQRIREYGCGWILATSLALVFSLCTESRVMINFVPLFVPPIAETLDTHFQLSARKLGLLTLLSLVVSRFWLPIGNVPTSEHFDLNKPPDLFYFMNFGPWMTHEVYLVLLAVTVVLGILILKFLYPRRAIDSTN